MKHLNTDYVDQIENYEFALNLIEKLTNQLREERDNADFVNGYLGSMLANLASTNPEIMDHIAERVEVGAVPSCIRKSNK